MRKGIYLEFYSCIDPYICTCRASKLFLDTTVLVKNEAFMLICKKDSYGYE